LKEEALDHTKWRACFGRGFGCVVRQTTKWMNVLHIMSMCLCSGVSYSVCKSHLFCTTLHCHVSPVWLYHICALYLTNSIIFGKNVLDIKCVSDFLYNFVWNTLIVLRTIKWDVVINV
jgi:hypothetical protein